MWTTLWRLSALPFAVRAAWLAARLGKLMLASYKARFAYLREDTNQVHDTFKIELIAVDRGPKVLRFKCLSGNTGGSDTIPFVEIEAVWQETDGTPSCALAATWRSRLYGPTATCHGRGSGRRPLLRRVRRSLQASLRPRRCKRHTGHGLSVARGLRQPTIKPRRTRDMR